LTSFHVFSAFRTAISKTRAWVGAFFDRTVRDQWADLKRLVGEASKSQPEVTVHVLWIHPA